MQNTSMKKVSIIVPVYNRENKIEDCINCIQKQTYSNIEIVCVNDGSTDNSWKKLESIASKDNRIIIYNKENGGPSTARNKGIEIASGEYIQFVDSDDLIDSDMVYRLVNAIEYNAADLAVCGYRFSNGLPERIPTAGVWKREDFVDKLYEFYTKGFLCSPFNKMYVKDKIVHLFNENLDLGEDAVFNINYLKNVQSICTVDFAPYYYYVGDETSLSWRFNENAFMCEEVKNSLILEFIKKEGKDEQESLFKEEFKKDFIRCLDNEIIKGNRRVKELTQRIYDYIVSPFWVEVFLRNVTLSKDKEKEIYNEIRKYILRHLHLRYRRIIKDTIYSVIK